SGHPETMMGFLIVAIIIFALVQRHRSRRMCNPGTDRWSRKWDRHMRKMDRIANKWESQMSNHDKWDKWSKDWERWSKDFEDWGRAEWKEFKAWSKQQDWKSGAKDIEAAARDFQRKLKERLERESGKLHGIVDKDARNATVTPPRPEPRQEEP